MAIKPFTRSFPKDPATANLESSVDNCWNSILKNPLLQNLCIIKNIAITTADTVITHTLGYNYTGWLLIRNNANVTVYESSTVNKNTASVIILKASGTATVSIMLF